MARILLIEDEASVRQPIARFLERSGHQVLPAENGDDGLRQWREHGADLVITDIHMPVKNGLETILELQYSEPPARILVMSGGDETSRLQLLGTAALLRIVGTISKPCALSDLLKAVEAALQAPAPPRSANCLTLARRASAE